MRANRSVSRRQAEALLDAVDAEASDVQAREACRLERVSALGHAEDVRREVNAELDLRFEFRTATEAPPVTTPWMRMDPEERAEIRAARRRARLVVLEGNAHSEQSRRAA